MPSRSFSSEKSYSSSGLKCRQAAAEPWGHRIEECLPFSGIFDLQLLRQVEIIPADDAVLDEPLAGFLHLLVFFLCLQEFPRDAYRDSARKAVGEVV